ncbi:MAG: hypothetical protein KBC66_00285 [Kiritimatiellae bacterium]|jgi:hypothetical protein|nr:hypothetical protein [Kiritimatiellia bacterium]
MKTLVIIVAILLAALVLPGEAMTDTLFVVRGSLEHPPAPDSEMASARYRVVEEGRGHMETNHIMVIFWATTEKTEPLPSDAILLLEKGEWARLPDGKGRGIYNVIGHDPLAGIIPFSKDNWDSILQKSDEELTATPEENQLPSEKAVALLRERLHQKYGMPQHIYIYPPRRVPFGWSLAALCVQNGAVKSLRARISDKGKIIGEQPNHRPIKFFDDLEVSAEEMDQFIREYHRNTPPEKWPKLDTGPVSSAAESDPGAYEFPGLPTMESNRWGQPLNIK